MSSLVLLPNGEHVRPDHVVAITCRETFVQVETRTSFFIRIETDTPKATAAAIAAELNAAQFATPPPQS